MSQIVLGIGTSHSPLLTLDVDAWIEKAADDRSRRLSLADGRTVTYEELHALVGDRHAPFSKREHLAAQHQECQQSLDRLAGALQESSPDAVVIVGDDQAELFSFANMPAISIFYGDTLITHPWDDVEHDMPNWKRAAAIGYGMDRARSYCGAPKLARSVIEGLIRRGVDVAVASEVVDPRQAGFGHAYGFIAERLFAGCRYPILPVLLNTYFPPNVPTPARCYDIGRALRTSLEESGDLRVAVIASGGLSHFVTDETLDNGVLNAFSKRDVEHLRSIPTAALRSGSSEILNWILAAGALEGLSTEWTNYVPVYRTPAGTGIGMSFMIWR